MAPKPPTMTAPSTAAKRTGPCPGHDAVAGIVKSEHLLFLVIASADNAEMLHVEPAVRKPPYSAFCMMMVTEYGDDCVILFHDMILLGLRLRP